MQAMDTNSQVSGLPGPPLPRELYTSVSHHTLSTETPDGPHPEYNQTLCPVPQAPHCFLPHSPLGWPYGPPGLSLLSCSQPRIVHARTLPPGPPQVQVRLPASEKPFQPRSLPPLRSAFSTHGPAQGTAVSSTFVGSVYSPRTHTGEGRARVPLATKVSGGPARWLRG